MALASLGRYTAPTWRPDRAIVVARLPRRSRRTRRGALGSLVVGGAMVAIGLTGLPQEVADAVILSGALLTVVALLAFLVRGRASTDATAGRRTVRLDVEERRVSIEEGGREMAIPFEEVEAVRLSWTDHAEAGTWRCELQMADRVEELFESRRLTRSAGKRLEQAARVAARGFAQVLEVPLREGR